CRCWRRSNRLSRVGKAKRAHHSIVIGIDGRHVASLLCPPYALRIYANCTTLKCAEIFRAASPRDAIDGRDKNERGEDFNLSRQTGKERPCAGSSRARSRQFASHRPACAPKSSAS